MKKTLLIAVLMLGGCASFVASAPVQTYRAQGQAEAWHISGKLDGLKEFLTITVNGQDAISGQLSMWDGSGTVAGVYQGKPMSATCSTVRYQRRCQVLVGSEVAANLVF